MPLIKVIEIDLMLYANGFLKTNKYFSIFKSLHPRHDLPHFGHQFVINVNE